MVDVTLGEKVRVKREEKRLTQAELANKAGITQATISRVESGEVTRLKSDKLRSLAEALGVSVDFLVNKQERMEFDEALRHDDDAKVLFRGFERLPPERKRQVLDFVRYLQAEEKKQK